MYHKMLKLSEIWWGNIPVRKKWVNHNPRVFFPFVIFTTSLCIKTHKYADPYYLMRYLWVELAREMLSYSHACRTRRELLLVQHAVHLTGLATGRSGAGPAARRQETITVTQRAKQRQRKGFQWLKTIK